MAYVARQLPVAGCACKRDPGARARGAGRRQLPDIRCGCHGGLGADPPASLFASGMRTDLPSIVLLQAHLNRFADAATPPVYRFFLTPLASGKVDIETAGRTVAILARRLLESPTAGGELGGQVGSDLAYGGKDPTVWLSTNLPRLVQTVAGFADSKQLPAANLPPEPGAFGIPKTVLIAAGVGVVALVFLTKRKKRR